MFLLISPSVSTAIDASLRIFVRSSILRHHPRLEQLYTANPQERSRAPLLCPMPGVKNTNLTVWVTFGALNGRSALSSATPLALRDHPLDFGHIPALQEKRRAADCRAELGSAQDRHPGVNHLDGNGR